jgi:hypothetical protein
LAGTHTTTAVVRTSVEGIHSRAPVFIGPRTGPVEEVVEIGTLAVTTQARYGPWTENPRSISFKLMENADGAFELDSVTGELRTAKEIDGQSLEMISFFIVKIRAIEVNELIGEEMEFVDGVFTIVVQDASYETTRNSIKMDILP